MNSTRKRKTQAERTAQTREALIAATIDLLFTYGYSGVSTTMIPEAAGVSRGALQHHFGTKTTLMVSVVQAVYDDEVHTYTRAFGRLGKFRLANLPEVVWEVLSKPSGIAVLEILNGSRRDTELAERLVPIQDEIEQSSLDMLHRLLKIDHSDALKTVRLIVWSVRGLTVLKGLGVPDAELNQCVELLGELFDCADRLGKFDHRPSAATS